MIDLVAKHRSYWRWVAIIGLLWVAGLVAAPSAIRAAHDGRLGLVSRAMAGRSIHPVDVYLTAWWSFALVASIVLAVAAVAARIGLSHWVQIRAAARDWAGGLPRMSDRDVLVLAVWFGLIGGIAEAGYWTFAYYVRHEVTARAVSLDMFWTVPVSAILNLLVIGLLLMAAGRIVVRARPYLSGIAPLLFCVLIAYSFGRLSLPGIHPLALAAFCLGAGIAFVRFAAERSAPFSRFARRSALVGLACLLVIIVALPVSRQASFRASFRGLPPASQEKPNIILIIWDTVRAASMSLYGHSHPTTPNLERLSGQAVVFDRAITPASWTLPAHASLFTGLYHHQHNADRGSPLDDSAPTIAEALRQRGYQTGGFISNTYWVGSGFGLDRGFEWYEDRPRQRVETVLVSWNLAWNGVDPALQALGMRGLRRSNRISAERINASLLRWLDARNPTRPFFAFLNEFDAHEPYAPPPPAGFRFSRGTPLHQWNWLKDRRMYSSEERAQLGEAYDACIYYLDQQLGKLLGELDRRGILDNTLIILTSDHGETLGEHDARVLGHENNVYFEVVNVPLVFYWPSTLAGGFRVKAPVSLVDVGATILDLVDDDRESADTLPGTSLKPLLTRSTDMPFGPRPALSQANPADYHVRSKVWPIAKGPLHSVVNAEGLHYVTNAEREEFVFDVNVDPWEQQNLARSPTRQEQLDRFRETLQELLGAPVAQSASVARTGDLASRRRTKP